MVLDAGLLGIVGWERSWVGGKGAWGRFGRCSHCPVPSAPYIKV